MKKQAAKKQATKKPTTKAKPFMKGGRTKCYAEGGPVSSDKKPPQEKDKSTDKPASGLDRIRDYGKGSTLEKRMRDAGV